MNNGSAHVRIARVTEGGSMTVVPIRDIYRKINYPGSCGEVIETGPCAIYDDSECLCWQQHQPSEWRRGKCINMNSSDFIADLKRLKILDSTQCRVWFFPFFIVAVLSLSPFSSQLDPTLAINFRGKKTLYSGPSSVWKTCILSIFLRTIVS